MIVIGVYGSTIYKRKLVERIVDFCIKKLTPRIKTLDICVELDNNMDTADGYCYSVNPREFVLQIDNRLKGDDFITAVCHEMVHVKQYAKGELTEKRSAKTFEEYLELWYEKEAYKMQEVLLEQFKESRRSSAG